MYSTYSPVHPIELKRYHLHVRVSFHVGHLPTRFYIIMGQRCSHVVEHKPLSNHILVVCWNVEGCEHMPLDFHAPTKKSLTYKCQSPED